MAVTLNPPSGKYYVEQIYTGCLAEATYYVESKGEAAIIDPLRDPYPYIELAKKRNAQIKYIFETHFHADFVSGHVDLAKLTGGTIVFGPTAKPGYDSKVAEDGEKIKLGDVEIEVLHTPGHTPESSCFLLRDDNVPIAVFTGDTLFVGEVGRPDLAVKAANATPQELAILLFKGIRQKLGTLPDSVIVYPGHGAGSPCGKNLGKETFSTIGEQKQKNYVFNPELDEVAFAAILTKDLPQPPAYFFADASLNKSGPPTSFDEVMKAADVRLTPEQVKELSNEADVTILDTRPMKAFEEGYIPGSTFVGLTGQFAIFVGTVIPITNRIVLVCENGMEKEAVMRLARVGFDKVVGIADIEAWKSSGNKVETVTSISVKELADRVKNGIPVIDVRKAPEVDSVGKLKVSTLIPLNELEKRLGELDKKSSYTVHCAAGYRSLIAISLMKKHGFENLVHVEGGYQSIQKAGESEGLEIFFPTPKCSKCCVCTRS